VKAFNSLTTVVLLGALSVGSNVAVAKERNQLSDAGSHAMKSFDGRQKPGKRFGGAESSTTTPGNNAAADQNVRGPVNAGTLKQRNSLRSRTGPQNAGATQPAKNQPDLNTVRPEADVGPGTPVIADGPGHKTNRPSDTMKKITTIVRPHVVRQPQRPAGLGKIERNSIGAVIHRDTSHPRLSARVSAVPTGAPGRTTTETIANAGSVPTATVRLGHNLANPPLHGPIINGSSFRRSGSNSASIGGPTRNIALNGNTFRPRHP
jgi:hypothetical protein